VFPTAHLLGEDVAEATAYKVDWGNPGAGFVEPNEQAGALALRFPDRIEITQGDNLPQTLNNTLANAVTEHLQTDPNACLIGDIWDPRFGYTLPKDPFPL